MTTQGTPFWFELATRAPAASAAFYSRLFGWTVGDSDMPGYHLAHDGDDPVAGLMVPDEGQDVPPCWAVYFAVDDADASAAQIKALGGDICMGPDDIPGTGRFAVCNDPQGAVFCILQPEPMDPPAPEGAGAWNQQKPGRGNWLELMSTDPQAGFAFYAKVFGWTKGEAMDMGEMGTYQLFRHQGTDIGGMMGLGDAPVPNWLPYFGVNDAAAAIAAIKEGGGSVAHGPVEVPGPALIVVATDPQGAWFAVVAPKP